MDFHALQRKLLMADLGTMPDNHDGADGSDNTRGEPSLELPSLSLRRRKKAAAVQQPAPAPQPDPGPPSRPEPVREPEREPQPPPTLVASPTPAPVAEPSPQPERVRRPARDAVRLPALPGIVAALVTGAVVGILAVASVWLSTTACEAVRGTGSCGGGPGLVILVATLLLLAYLGGWMLRGFGVAEAGSTSFLGLGSAVVVLLALFSQSFDEVWMVVVAPVVTVAGYALAWWVTSQIAQEEQPSQEG